MTLKQKRFWYLSLLALFLGGVMLVVLTTLNDHLLFFMMPSDVVMKKPKTMIRLGGIVKEGSLKHQENFLITFQVTDHQHSIPVRYQGMVPDLLKEGKGVVVEGILSGEGVFEATYVLAKHDENYMPKEVADALKAKGQWRPHLQEKTS